MPTKGLFAWTALITGLVRNGDYALAVQSFEQMRVDGVLINEPFVISIIVCASSSFVALELGWQLHCLTIKLGFQAGVIVSNSLAEIYAKCSDIVSCKRVFDQMSYKYIVSWTTMIVALAQHGMAFDALAIFDRMVSTGIRPNEATFIGVLNACSHGGEWGKVSKVRNLMASMETKKEFGFSRTELGNESAAFAAGEM
ncbi:Pentatricopeptide repeat-containing protein [Acorus calamus]|uniref:Pentatricopeptide repeat-containing protein n=1 Tax=Acorus calamus TaxID=4465 RepID=A0AAV9EZ77_ACOCL|nr:Pentatricopeptide repeat-containing protein [Acorus calamus]